MFLELLDFKRDQKRSHPQWKGAGKSQAQEPKRRRGICPPTQNEPSPTVLEGLRLALKQSAHLRRARELWWNSRQTIRLDNQQWDVKAEEVVSPKEGPANAFDIVSARFDPRRYPTNCNWRGSRA